MKHYMQIIKNLMDKKKLTQDEISQMIGKNRNTITNYFTGKTKIDVDTLEDVAKALEVPVSYFFEDKEDVKKIINNTNGNIQVGQNNKSTAKTESEALAVCRKEVEWLKKEVELQKKIIEMLEKVKRD